MPLDFFSSSFAVLPYLASFVFGAGGGGLVGNIIVSRSHARREKELAVLRNEYETTNRKIQAQLDRASGVHRLRVEKEFSLLVETWEKVVATRRTMAGMRPVVDFKDPNENMSTTVARRMPAFADALESLKSSTFAAHPFFPRDINDKLEQMTKEAHREFAELRRFNGSDHPDWYERGEARNAAFGRWADELSDLIRNRMEKLSGDKTEPLE
jgi:hypothetical protein